MKKNILAFSVGLVIGAGPMLHLLYMASIVGAFEIGKHWPW